MSQPVCARHARRMSTRISQVRPHARSALKGSSAIAVQPTALNVYKVHSAIRLRASVSHAGKESTRTSPNRARVSGVQRAPTMIKRIQLNVKGVLWAPLALPNLSTAQAVQLGTTHRSTKLDV
jgi:hypothetical protein